MLSPTPIKPSYDSAAKFAIVIPRLHDTTGCQTGLTTALNEQPLFVQPCWTNSHCSFNRLSNRVVQQVWQRVWQPAVYTIQLVVKQPVWQQVVSCKRGISTAGHGRTPTLGSLATPAVRKIEPRPEAELDESTPYQIAALLFIVRSCDKRNVMDMEM